MSIKQMVMGLVLLMAATNLQAKTEKDNGEWIATWATATEYTGKGDMPKSGTLTGKSIKQIGHV